MASIRKRHEDFIRELQAPLKSSDLVKRQDICSSVSSSSNELFPDEQLIEELQKFFDDLFGPIEDSD